MPYNSSHDRDKSKNYPISNLSLKQMNCFPLENMNLSRNYQERYPVHPTKNSLSSNSMVPIGQNVQQFESFGGTKKIPLGSYKIYNEDKDVLQSSINIPNDVGNKEVLFQHLKGESFKTESKKEAFKNEIKVEHTPFQEDLQTKGEKNLSEGLSTKNSKEVAKNKEEFDSETELFRNDGKNKGNGENSKNNAEEDEILSPLTEEEEEIDPETQDYLLAQYEKVHRVRNKWKVTFKDAIFHLSGKEYVFERVNGELTRDW